MAPGQSKNQSFTQGNEGSVVPQHLVPVKPLVFLFQQLPLLPCEIHCHVLKLLPELQAQALHHQCLLPQLPPALYALTLHYSAVHA